MAKPKGRFSHPSEDRRKLAALRRRINKVRDFPFNTCPYSRHLYMMADALSRGEKYHMLDDEPEHCSYAMLVVVLDLWTRRRKDHDYEQRKKDWFNVKPPAASKRTVKVRRIA